MTNNANRIGVTLALILGLTSSAFAGDLRMRVYVGKNEIPCSLSDGTSVSDGGSVTRYLNGSVPYNSTCQTHTISCEAGVLTGDTSHIYKTCEVASPSQCATPWGSIIAHGTSIPAYLSSSVPFGSTCTSQTRTCDNGALSGSYTAGSCSVQAPASCNTPWGATVAHGASVQAYAANSVTWDKTCTSQTRTCTNGTLSGTNTFSSCTVGTPPSGNLTQDGTIFASATRGGPKESAFDDNDATPWVSFYDAGMVIGRTFTKPRYITRLRLYISHGRSTAVEFMQGGSWVESTRFTATGGPKEYIFDYDKVYAEGIRIHSLAGDNVGSMAVYTIDLTGY